MILFVSPGFWAKLRAGDFKQFYYVSSQESRKKCGYVRGGTRNYMCIPWEKT